MLLLDLGVLKVSSEKTDVNIENLGRGALDIEKVKEEAFDQFFLNLSRVQLLFVNPGKLNYSHCKLPYQRNNF